MSFKVASSLCTLFKSLHNAIMHGVFNITITNIFFYTNSTMLLS